VAKLAIPGRTLFRPPEKPAAWWGAVGAVTIFTSASQKKRRKKFIAGRGAGDIIHNDHGIFLSPGNFL
jgi:hypothetical protein